MTHTPELFRVDGKVALVSGGAGLYGRHICRALAEAGAHVVIASRDLDACDAAAAELVADGLAASTTRLDQGDEASITDACASIATDHGGVDIFGGGRRDIGKDQPGGRINGFDPPAVRGVDAPAADHHLPWQIGRDRHAGNLRSRFHAHC